MKKLFTTLCLTALFALSSISAYAGVLTPQQALQNARHQFNSGPNRVSARFDTQRDSLVYTMTNAGSNTLYVFNFADGGYLIAAADDVATPLLGYSDTGSFDPQNIPENLQAWLQGYSLQISEAQQNGYTSGPKHVASNMAPVQPITKTLWDQSTPYNDQCPLITATNGTQSRAVTGCVATAMAQVMKVHNWPEQGSGSNQYTFYAQGNNYTQSMDFSSVNFDWANMTDTYGSNSTDVQKQAVATLMHCCGVAVDMSYGISESGAQGYNAGKALINNFGYDVGARYLDHGYIGGDEWEQILYAELAAGRPVLYFGQGSEGGHAFICDGYSSNGYYHFNWGWSGMSDGYYVLTALDPPALGIGGAGGGFNADQQMIVGIQPPQPGSVPGAVMVVQGTLIPQSQTYQSGQTIVFSGVDGGAFIGSLSLSKITATLGFKLTDADGNVQYVESEVVDHSFSPMSGYGTLSAFASEFPQGSYTVTPAFKYNDQWQDVLLPLDYPYTLTATCQDGYITFNAQAVGSLLNIDSFTLDTPIYTGDLCSFTVQISATGDYYGDITPILVQDGEEIARGTAASFSLSEGESTQYQWITKFSGSGLTAGAYTLIFLDDNDNTIGQGYTVQVYQQESGTPAVTVSNIMFGASQATGRSSDPILIDPNDIDVILTLNCTQGFWSDYVCGMFFDPTTLRSVGQTEDVFVGLETDQSNTIELKGTVSGLIEGQTYYFTPWAVNNGKQLSSVYYVQVRNSSNVVGITPDMDTTPKQIFNLNGEQMHNDVPLAPGIYIVRQGGKTLKLVIR